MRTLLENELVRVRECRLAPGQACQWGEGPDGVQIQWTEPVDVASSSAPASASISPLAFWFPASDTRFSKSSSSGVLMNISVELKAPAAAVLAAPVGADGVGACPCCTRVLLENKRVRVYLVELQPGERLAMHVHPPNLAYALTPVKLKFTQADGSTALRELPAGAAAWNGPMKHEVENAGGAAARFVHVELKSEAGAARPGTEN